MSTFERSYRRLIIGLSCALVLVLAYLGVSLGVSSTDAPRLRSLCEAQGGVLVASDHELLVCVPRPPIGLT